MWRGIWGFSSTGVRHGVVVVGNSPGNPGTVSEVMPRWASVLSAVRVMRGCSQA